MKNLKTIMGAVAMMTALVFTGCSQKEAATTTLSGLNPAKFDSTIDGKKTALYTLKNAAGMKFASQTLAAASYL